MPDSLPPWFSCLHITYPSYQRQTSLKVYPNTLPQSPTKYKITNQVQPGWWQNFLHLTKWQANLKTDHGQEGVEESSRFTLEGTRTLGHQPAQPHSCGDNTKLELEVQISTNVKEISEEISLIVATSYLCWTAQTFYKKIYDFKMLQHSWDVDFLCVCVISLMFSFCSLVQWNSQIKKYIASCIFKYIQVKTIIDCLEACIKL